MDKTIIPSSKNLMMPLLEFAADGKKLIELYKKIVLIAILAIATTTVAMAQVGTEFNDNNSGLYFRVISVSPNMVEVIKNPDSPYTGSVNIPSSVSYIGANYSVTSIGNQAFYQCSSLTTVNMGNSVTAIGYYAFDGCSSLTSINIPNSVTSIGIGAFLRCSSLPSINIPNSVTTIEESAFAESGIADINVGSSNPRFASDDGILFSKDMDTIICYPPGKTNSTYTIPGSVTAIGDYAFPGCSNLTTVNIGYFVTAIGRLAFYGCSSLTTVNMGNSVTTIGDYAFYGCSSLTSINIPNSVTSIGESAFYGSGIADINVGSSNPRFASDNGILFSKDMDTIICYPPGKTNSTYTIPGSVTAIGDYAFSGCSNLTSIDIPNFVTSIGKGAFLRCSSLTSISIPNSVTSIGESAFYECSSLTTINIPNSVTSIGEAAFSGCSSLTTVNMGNSVTTIGELAFYGCSSLTTVNMGNSVTTIGNSAFYECSSLTTINIPNSVTSIGEAAFLRCSSLTTVNIGNSVTTIGNWAFYWCSSLRKIKIDVTNPASIGLGRNVFENVPKGASANACILLVPPGSVPAYGNAPQWSEFMPNILEPQNFAIGYNQPTGGTLAVLNAADDSNIPSGSGVEYGTVIKVAATPDNNYRLDSIKVNGTITANNSTVTITQHTTVEAFFSLKKYRIQYTHTAGGTLAILNAADGSNIPRGSQVEHGTVINIAATPDNGYHLSKVEVNEETFTGTQITVEKHTYIYAEFATVTGIDHSGTALGIYPTPASEYITVATEVGSSPVPVTVTDLSGRTVLTAIATGSKTVINISHLSAGTYIVRVGDRVGKVVKR